MTTHETDDGHGTKWINGQPLHVLLPSQRELLHDPEFTAARLPAAFRAAARHRFAYHFLLLLDALFPHVRSAADARALERANPDTTYTVEDIAP